MTQHRGAGRPLVGRDDEQLQDAAGRAGPRRGRDGLGRRRPPSTPTCSAASRRRSSATRTRRSSRRSPPRRTSSATSPTWPCTSRASDLAERLLELAGRPGRVFFCNSGAEANEAAFKISRLTGRPEVVTAEGAFHGRTMGALALTGQPAKAAAFAPLPGGVRYVPYGDVDALAGAVADADRDGAARADAGRGRRAARPARLPGRRPRRPPRTPARCSPSTRCRPAWAAPARWFMHQADGLQPDVITLAKALGGGLPMGALLAFGEAADLLTAGAHGSTFGGNPIAAAAALAVLDTIRDEGLLERAKELEHRFTAGIEGLGHPGISRRPGAGRAARRRPHRRRRRRAGDAAARRRLPHQRRRAGRAPARPAARAHRRAGRRLRRRPARRPRRCPGDTQ